VSVSPFLQFLSEIRMVMSSFLNVTLLPLPSFHPLPPTAKRLNKRRSEIDRCANVGEEGKEAAQPWVHTIDPDGKVQNRMSSCSEVTWQPFSFYLIIDRDLYGGTKEGRNITAYRSCKTYPQTNDVEATIVQYYTATMIV
jgi:hypothetical protein